MNTTYHITFALTLKYTSNYILELSQWTHLFIHTKRLRDIRDNKEVNSYLFLPRKKLSRWGASIFYEQQWIKIEWKYTKENVIFGLNLINSKSHTTFVLLLLVRQAWPRQPNFFSFVLQQGFSQKWSIKENLYKRYQKKIYIQERKYVTQSWKQIDNDMKSKNFFSHKHNGISTKAGNLQ